MWGIYWGVVYVVAKQVFGQRMSKAPIQYLSLPAMMATLAFVTFGFYLFRCGTGTQMLTGFRYLWAYALTFAVLVVAAIVFVKVVRLLQGHRVVRCAILGLFALCVAGALAVNTALWIEVLKLCGRSRCCLS